MTEQTDSTSGRRGKGSAGTPRGVSKRDESAPGAAGTRQDSKIRLKRDWRHVPKASAAVPYIEIFRKTGQFNAPTQPEEEEELRQKYSGSLVRHDDAVPDRQFETVFWDLFRSFKGRQGWIEWEILRRIANLRQKVRFLKRKAGKAGQKYAEHTRRRP
jgi:hypothetical protein